jgi:hypothetical protein
MRVEAERNLLSLVGQRVVGGIDGSKREISRKTIALVDSLGGAFLFEHDLWHGQPWRNSLPGHPMGTGLPPL